MNKWTQRNFRFLDAQTMVKVLHESANANPALRATSQCSWSQESEARCNVHPLVEEICQSLSSPQVRHKSHQLHTALCIEAAQRARHVTNPCAPAFPRNVLQQMLTRLHMDTAARVLWSRYCSSPCQAIYRNSLTPVQQDHPPQHVRQC